MMAEKLLEVRDGPKCPRCGWDQFDDWWHVLRNRPKHRPGGKLECECGVFFIEGEPGSVVFSSCYGVRKPEYRA